MFISPTGPGKIGETHDQDINPWAHFGLRGVLHGPLGPTHTCRSRYRGFQPVRHEVHYERHHMRSCFRKLGVRRGICGSEGKDAKVS